MEGEGLACCLLPSLLYHLTYFRTPNVLRGQRKRLAQYHLQRLSASLIKFAHDFDRCNGDPNSSIFHEVDISAYQLWLKEMIEQARLYNPIPDRDEDSEENPEENEENSRREQAYERIQALLQLRPGDFEEVLSYPNLLPTESEFDRGSSGFLIPRHEDGQAEIMSLSNPLDPDYHDLLKQAFDGRRVSADDQQKLDDNESGVPTRDRMTEAQKSDLERDVETWKKLVKEALIAPGKRYVSYLSSQ